MTFTRNLKCSGYPGPSYTHLYTVPLTLRSQIPTFLTSFMNSPTCRWKEEKEKKLQVIVLNQFEIKLGQITHSNPKLNTKPKIVVFCKEAKSNNHVCCIFWPGNGCFTLHLLVKRLLLKTHFDVECKFYFFTNMLEDIAYFIVFWEPANPVV